MNNEATTANGMSTYESSLDNCVDLFYKIGASRGKDIIPAFRSAFNEDPDMALRIAQWVRDVRGGSGERQLFRDILINLAENDEMACRALMVKTPEVGRWDDLLSLIGTPLEKDALTLITQCIEDGTNANNILNSIDDLSEDKLKKILNNRTSTAQLCCKWMPRKGLVAVKLRSFMGLSPKAYRKTLVELTNVVETNMCAKEWDSIDFGKLPSVASARYQKAFNKNAHDVYGEFKKQLEEGTATVNAGAVYPYDIVKSLKMGDSAVANAQWKNLPNYMEGSDDRILPVIDVSGSMCCPAGNSSSVSCKDVAISLGLYISERNEGIFKDKFITFSSEPTFQSLDGTLERRYDTIARSEWGFSTDIEKVFNLILTTAMTHDVPEKDMPSKILILSDMQFNSCTKIGDNFMDMIDIKYEHAGYTAPEIIFWNINDCGNVPVTFDSKGVALVSGFSPALMKSVIACESLTPVQMMKDTVCIERYDWC